jgi:hypothetical protein
VVNLAEKTYSQLTEHQYHYVPFCNIAGLTFSDFQKVNPLSHPMWVHFGAFCYTRLGKKNAQNVGFEHFGTLWYSIHAEREGLLAALVIPKGGRAQHKE